MAKIKQLIKPIISDILLRQPSLICHLIGTLLILQ
jgi:hypothetical protein